MRHMVMFDFIGKGCGNMGLGDNIIKILRTPFPIESQIHTISPFLRKTTHPQCGWVCTSDHVFQLTASQAGIQVNLRRTAEAA